MIKRRLVFIFGYPKCCVINSLSLMTCKRGGSIFSTGLGQQDLLESTFLLIACSCAKTKTETKTNPRMKVFVRSR